MVLTVMVFAAGNTANPQVSNSTTSGAWGIPASDPGPRGGPPGAGGPIDGLTPDQQSFFSAAQGVFKEVDGVPQGLGPRFNGNGCAFCHAQPAVGGTSPATNPQFQFANRYNKVPYFVTPNGPIREARFKYFPNGSLDGAVHDVFTITGRSDAPGCTLAQPDFNGAAARNNIIFRIPTPTFGSGLIENIEDSTIIANKNTNLAAKTALGISGVENRTGNDGTITRFGWKAQNKSLVIFAGEAYNVEVGVTNQLFQQERDETPACLFNPLPESIPDPLAATPAATMGDIETFGFFMRFLAPPDTRARHPFDRPGQ